MITLRNNRHDSLKAERLKTDKSMSEDDIKRFEKSVDELMASQKSEIDSLAKTKETDIVNI